MTAPGLLQAGDSVYSPWFGKPVPITQGFYPGSGYEPNHTGVDVGVGLGTPVYSDVTGTVQDLVDPTGFGNYEKITVAGSGQNGVPLDQIILGHLSKWLVPSGSQVTPGQEIGLSGSTGWSTGPHTHVQQDINGAPVDPSQILQGYGTGGSSKLNIPYYPGGVLQELGVPSPTSAISTAASGTAGAVASGVSSGLGSAFGSLGTDVHDWGVNHAWPQIKGVVFPLLIAAVIIVVVLKPGQGGGSSMPMPIPV